MSTEVCPFCGKAFKRLKSHLPHCKAASSSKKLPTKHEVTANQTQSSSQLAAASSESTAVEKKSTQTLQVASPQSKKSKKMSEVSSAPVNSSSVSQSSSLSSALPLSSSKKKQKLSEQIKMATSTLPISPSLSPSSKNSEPKKKSLRALIEAAKSNQVPTASLEGTTPSDLLGVTPAVTDPPSSRTKTDKQTDKDRIKENSNLEYFSADSKPKVSYKMKATKTKKASQSPSTSKETSYLNQSTAKPCIKDNFGLEDEEEVADLSVNKMFSKSGSGQQTRITLQDVKTTLGRAKSNRQSILSQIQTEDLGSKISPEVSKRNQESSLVSAATLAEKSLSVISQNTELKSVMRKSSKPKQAALILLKHEGAPQPGLNSPKAPVLPGYLSSQVNQTMPPSHTVSVNEGLKVEPSKTGLLTISPSLIQLSSPHISRPSLQTLEAFRAEDGSQLEARRQITAQNGAKGTLTDKSLGQVRLRELPEWLTYKTPTHPREVMEMCQRGWQWYYKRYIDVKKGGVGGVGMLLAGYCVLSYIWSYPHIKRDRWRKYH
ncbi:uncharacterized protein C17orf80 homolog [Cheilinus undulatus]|uniref:uncharacterized protein C17orf80 homolog n=1 Tax=Cheilinus undulatus TaxID=241271 RepID=UPI001BD4BA7B|nr:uncharacterized protein C17orf80 homolog [Cheilinus undulatus]